jgi:hypothetical protein
MEGTTMHLQRSLAAVSLAAFLAASAQAPANAAAIATRDAVAPAAATDDRDGQLARVRATLARDEVRTALVARGVDPDAAAARVAALSDRQLADLATQLDEPPAGGSALAGRPEAGLRGSQYGTVGW